MSYWNKEKKKANLNIQKKKNNFNQSLTSSKGFKSEKKIKKSLQYLLLLKKFDDLIDYKNVKLLKAFLNKYGKIRSRRKTRVSIQKQKLIAKAIKKSRVVGLIPFVCDVNS
jgi:small subunit ribosomal protein S18